MFFFFQAEDGIRDFCATNDPYWNRSGNVCRTEYCFDNECIPGEQTWSRSRHVINNGKHWLPLEHRYRFCNVGYLNAYPYLTSNLRWTAGHRQPTGSKP